MSAHRLWIASQSLSAQFSRIAVTPTASRVTKPHQARFLSSSGGGGKDDEEKDDKKDAKIDDPFGVHFQDGSDGLGITKPPMYKRDTTTGRLTGEVVAELSEKDKRVLGADSLELDRMLLGDIENHWSDKGKDESGLPAELDDLGKRIRDTELATTVLGRSVKAQAESEMLDDGSELGRDESGFSQHITKEEFKSFAEYMKIKHDVTVDEGDIPVQDNSSSDSYRPPSSIEDDPDGKKLALKWLTARAQRQMDDNLDDNPYSDLMPGDLNPTRLVNRKNAKKIPVRLLHHNNIELLRHFITPTGQIRNRVQTRLGARDQRRVAKLTKRARALGLIPYQGQFKYETHGWEHTKDIGTMRPWEEELAKRGLVIEKKTTTATERQEKE